MGIKEDLLKEKEELLNIKKPYETAAALLFGIFFIQQIFYILINIFDYFKRIGIRNDFVDNGGATYAVNFSFSSKVTTPNMPAFVLRVLGVDSSKFIWILASFVFLALWYGLIYLLVWNYLRKRGLAKWTWSALIAFGPTSILLVPTYLIYAIYVFRPYVFRFIRRGVDEYQKYGKDYTFKEETEEYNHDDFEV
jgi:hypothetical protein